MEIERFIVYDFDLVKGKEVCLKERALDILKCYPTHLKMQNKR